MMFFDIKENKPTSYLPTGVMGQISYQRLLEVLRKSGEFKEGEIVTHLHFKDDVLAYRVEKKMLPTKKAKAFIEANNRSPVVEGFAKNAENGGGNGGIYHLQDGKTFDLSLEDCQSLPEGYPKWAWDFTEK